MVIHAGGAVKRKVTYEMAGRKPKGEPDETFDKNGTKRTTMRFAPELLADVAKVRLDGETFTAQVEDGLRRHIRARRKRQVSD